jgi:hypothetical protein
LELSTLKIPRATLVALGIFLLYRSVSAIIFHIAFILHKNPYAVALRSHHIFLCDLKNFTDLHTNRYFDVQGWVKRLTYLFRRRHQNDRL